MIKINLAKSTGSLKSALQADGSGGATLSKEAQTQAGIHFFILLLGPIALWLYADRILIPEKTALVAQKTKIIGELTAKNNSAASAVTEMKSFEAAESKLKLQINAIESLRRDRMREVRLMDVIQRDMPEKMWITKLQLKADSATPKIYLEGFAGTGADRAQLMEALNKSGLLKDAKLIKFNEETIDGNKLESFSIDCIFPVPDAPPAASGVKS